MSGTPALAKLLISLDQHKDRITVWKDLAAILQSVATVAALAFGGVWTYWLFIEQRQTKPRLKFEHKLSQHKLPSGDILISVDELLSNSGSILLSLQNSETRVVQVLPFPFDTTKFTNDMQGLPDISRTPKTWTVLRVKQRQWAPGEKVLEPGEDDQLHSEFILPREIREIAVVTYVTNPSDPKLGWHHITLYDITDVPEPPRLKPRRK